jgi:hypothetical protein
MRIFYCIILLAAFEKGGKYQKNIHLYEAENFRRFIQQ